MKYLLKGNNPLFFYFHGRNKKMNLKCPNCNETLYSVTAIYVGKIDNWIYCQACDKMFKIKIEIIEGDTYGK